MVGNQRIIDQFIYRNVMRFSACTLGGLAPSNGIGRDFIWDIWM